jgi:hypothetical protein
VKVINKSIEFETHLDVSEYDKGLLKEGGASNYLRRKLK